ncbi:methyltransferase regulatory domain-containing protein [Antarcticirhabdus aurantiaca]|uniref:Methyltransferase regulatory domain-containing protein n=1 Tax=Antarcticirhabdus aurantiaca TaxID=2606717 RepID=A0ACD4NTL8_9HYPH|nr:methyltransferase regulatory domain-containing protein [Antarcticirhabdus aurantiaca]WAJ29952.1 methyltransferase regulatory domain-containing protein [Jeongeuplla avenae]
MALATDWTQGYVADLGYTHGFYRELTPTMLSFVALAAGQASLDATTPFRFCELGCGQGVSMNVLAAANPHAEFYATDFNPSQVAGARALAAEAGLTNLSFFDTPFAAFANEPGLPVEFDVIALHGIYSWVGAENRQAIVDFIARKLKVGGLVYVSYNALPGWSGSAPLRQLMYLHGKATGGPTGGRLEPALAFAERLINANAAFFRVNPGLKERFERLKGQPRNYLAHEYFNDAWSLFYHSDVAADLSAAKLTFLGSAALLEGVDGINLTEEQRTILAETQDPTQREVLKDYMFNQQFRRDVFVKGPLPVPPRIAREAWLAQRFALSTPRPDVTLTVRGALGDANLQADVYNPIIEALADGPKTLQALVADKAIDALGSARIIEALTVLIGAGHVQPCLPTKDEGKRAKSTRAFNAAVCERARDNADLSYLASPVTGGGITVDRIQQLFLLAISQNAKQPDDWAKFAWTALSTAGQRMVKDGKTLATPEENVAELAARASTFAEKTLPVLKSLQVA